MQQLFHKHLTRSTRLQVLARLVGRYVSRSNIQYMCCDVFWDCSEGDIFCHRPVLCVYAGKMFLFLSWGYVGVEESNGWRLLQYCSAYLNTHLLPTLHMWHLLTCSTDKLDFQNTASRQTFHTFDFWRCETLAVCLTLGTKIFQKRWDIM